MDEVIHKCGACRKEFPHSQAIIFIKPQHQIVGICQECFEDLERQCVIRYKTKLCLTK